MDLRYSGYQVRQGEQRRVVQCSAFVLVMALCLLLISACTTLPSATITITPANSDLKETYTFSAVTGKPDPAQHQIQARLITSKASAPPATVEATGVKQTDAVAATGTLTFYNGSAVTLSIASGTVLVGNDGVSVVTDTVAIIPPATPPSYGSVDVPAHAVQPGASGNIATLDVNQVCCIAGNYVFVKNLAAFSGGQDKQNYTYVQQSDIDSAVRALTAGLTSSVQSDLQNQIDPQKERLVGQVQCMPSVTSNYKVGDKADTVTVNVSEVCADEAYDQQAVLAMATDLLAAEAKTKLTTDYVLSGTILTAVIRATMIDTKRGTVALLVNAEGLWVYQMSDTLKQTWAQQIAGKSKQDATTLLMRQTGVENVDIQLSGSNTNTLPSDPNQVAITIQRIPGPQGTPTETSSPTVPNGS